MPNKASSTSKGAQPYGMGRALVRASVRPLLTATGLVVAYYLLPMDRSFTGGGAVALVLGLLAVLMIFTWQLRAIARSPRPRLRAFQAFTTLLPLFLLLFAAAYYLMERSAPRSFTEPLTRTDALYFTLTVFSTVGLGDIAARSEPARIVTMVQMTSDVLVLGVAARMAVGAVQAGLRRQRGDVPASQETGRGEEHQDG